MESDQLCNLLELNDRLTSAIARYEEIYYSKKSNKLPVSDTALVNNTQENNQIEDTTNLTENNESEAKLPFQIGDDKYSNGILILDEEDDDDKGDLKNDNVDDDNNNADIHELRKKKEIEEGEAFKHSKDTDLS